MYYTALHCVILLTCNIPVVHVNMYFYQIGKSANRDLLYVMFYCVFVILPCGVLGLLSSLIVSIPDRCLLFYFARSQVIWIYSVF